MIRYVTALFAEAGPVVATVTDRARPFVVDAGSRA